PDRPLPRLARDPGGDVARTLHHHRRLAEPRLPPVELAPVRADLGRLGPPPRQPRPLPPPLPPLPPLRAVLPVQRGQAPAARTRPGGFAVMSRDDPTRPVILAEFGSAEALIAAATRLRELGYRRLETYSPYPLDGAEAALSLPRPRLPWVVLAGGLLGA